MKPEYLEVLLLIKTLTHTSIDSKWSLKLRVKWRWRGSREICLSFWGPRDPTSSLLTKKFKLLEALLNLNRMRMNSSIAERPLKTWWNVNMTTLVARSSWNINLCFTKLLKTHKNWQIASLWCKLTTSSWIEQRRCCKFIIRGHISTMDSST